MNEDQREAIRDSARYLRQVRPLDPAELRDYVSGGPATEDVRQVLREEALALGLVERDDGRFEPVSDGPLDVTMGEISGLPPSLEQTVGDILSDRLGPAWPDGESGERLRSAIREFKRRYHRGAAVAYDADTALGYLIYHFPAYFAASQYVIGDLAADGLIPSHLRVLDVGAGVGGPALGLDHLIPDDALVDYHAVEPSPAVEILDELLAETGRNFHASIHRESIEAFAPGALEVEGDGLAAEASGEYFDLILVANVLSELDDPAGQVARALSWLDPDGSLVALAPADRNTAIALRTTERAVEGETDATIYGPAVRLWPHERPESESWSFDRKPALETPTFQRHLDEGERPPTELASPEASRSGASEASDSPEDSEGGDQAADADEGVAGAAREPGDGEFVNTDVQYAYSILRLDGRRAIDFWASSTRAAKLAETEAHVTDRIDCVAIKLSHDLAAQGNSLYLVGDGSQTRDHFAVLANQTALNQDLSAADYGALLRFENGLVLWNDDERAYNLVVDEETVVDRIPV